MNQKLKIKVKQRHISRGRALSSSSCPIALALKSEGFESPMVDKSFISVVQRNGFVKRGTRIVFATPSNVKRFVRSFDWFGSRLVKPFQFTLRNGV